MMGLAFVFIVGTLMCLFIEGSYIGAEEVELMNQLTGYNTLQLTGTSLWEIPKLAVGFFTHGLPKMIMWDYSFFDGGWGIVKWIFCYPISCGVVYGIGVLFKDVLTGILGAFS
jgi:hypothetical protein